MNRVKLTTIIFALIAGLAVSRTGQASVVTFINDYEGFVQAAGDVQTIGFELLPDGSPTLGGEELTPEFNYTDWGVTFSSPVPNLSLHGFALEANSYPANDRNWIIADLVTPATAAGFFYPPGFTTASIFDTSGLLLASETFGSFGNPFVFLGFVSDAQIGSATLNRGDTAVIANSFHFTPIPEPASLALLALGAVAIVHRRHTRRSRQS